MTTMQSLYRNRLFVVGTVLIVLGLGNAIAADFKVNQYQAMMTDVAAHMHVVRSFLPRPQRRHFPSEARERWAIARGKLDFYHVVQSGGRLMISLGTGCTVLALVRLRRQRRRFAQE